MRITIDIDPNSGFCYGVVRAVEQAESFLDKSGQDADRGSELYSLGLFVHNKKELDRLAAKGLKMTDIEHLKDLRDSTVLIRAHGEPPSTYEIIERQNLRMIDCTCPVVLALQKKIRNIYIQVSKERGKVLIFGKKGHPEVNGLIGQVDGDAIVIEGVGDLEKEIESGRIDLCNPVALFSQTTKDPEEYSFIASFIKECISKKCSDTNNLEVYNTICIKVSSRKEHLKEFSKTHSVILFISGKESSNGKVLFDLCKSVNPRSYFIDSVEQIDPTWFKDGDSIGICGATSTPQWQLNQVSDYIYDTI